MSSPYIPRAYLGRMIPLAYLGGFTPTIGLGFAFPSAPMIPGAYLGRMIPLAYLGGFTPTIRPYVPPSPTGWSTSAGRRGPDPDFATSVRRAGLE